MTAGFQDTLILDIQELDQLTRRIQDSLSYVEESETSPDLPRHYLLSLLSRVDQICEDTQQAIQIQLVACAKKQRRPSSIETLY